MIDAGIAPDLSDGLEWVNCTPRRMHDQRGRVVALAFWSAGSTYSHNVLDDLQALLGRYSDSFTVIGIHTPKFEAERNPKVALKAINRIGFRQPVAHDPNFLAWQHYQVRAWPSVVLIDTEGRVAQSFSGDLQRDEMDRAIQELLERAGPTGRVYEAHTPLVRAEPRLPLLFPSGLAVGLNHLYVVDSGHHRILECSHEGRILRQFGSGNPGFLDGNSAECSFQYPRGICIVRDALYIADTGNHALRRIRLLDGDTDTLAGNGKPGQIPAVAEGPPASMPLNAPWGVTGSFDKLYLAMTGAQQIWEYDLTRRSMRVLAGSGRLGLADGIGTGAAFAQPAALALVQQSLYVADSASSAIRTLHVTGGQVHTLIGQGLFEFGDQDGARQNALLQYPLGLALDARSPQLWIADTYNNAVKVLRLGGGELKRYEMNYRLHEPGALACSPGALWVANTDSHEVVRVDLDGGQIRRLPIGE